MFQLALALCGPAGAHQQMPGFSEALRAALPSVVSVYGEGLDSESGVIEFEPQALQRAKPVERSPWTVSPSPATIGAGFFIDGKGTLVTAAHVVTNSQRVLVKTADLQVVVAELIGADEDVDIAVLRVRGVASPVPTFGRPAASRPGDWVLAVGEPFGLQRSVVAGIVAGRARHFAEDTDGFYIQSDLSLNPGNSGGPLLNTSGAIIGMNLRTVVGPYGTAGVSLSIPIGVVLQIAHELQHGSASRPRLGASFEDVAPSAALAAGRRYASGAFISALKDDGMGRVLGLQLGDIVVGMNDHPIEDSADLARWLLAWRELRGTRLVVWRDGAYRVLSAPSP
ncbi:MAG TPA: trypsin-like peptidase domain-containing protein [Rhizobacter sp.]|nr:trypsin-like peptidase domain-containing protein [Rhizobacter sp.]